MSAHQFKVGDHVVCIDAEWHDVHPVGTPCPLVKGETYTVASIGPGEGLYRAQRGHISIRLNEAFNFTPIDIGFASSRFRPVVKRATDISIFTALLTPSEDDIIEIELLDFELERQFQ